MTPGLIVAGCVEDIHPGAGQWAFVDLGFSKSGKTTAILIDRGTPELHTFDSARRRLLSLASEGGAALNLVLEAPLSVCFTAQGNPAGRSFEKSASGHRYWYAGLGCQVTLAAAYILRTLVEAAPARPVRLFEAFVSFKPKGAASVHAADVQAMREVAWATTPQRPGVVAPRDLMGPDAARIESAFRVFGFDLGVPPVIVAGAQSFGP